MSLDMTPERLNTMAEQYAEIPDRFAQVAALRAQAAKSQAVAAALRVAAWLAVPGNRLIAETNDHDEIIAHEAYTEGSVEPTGVGLTALAAVLDAVAVKP
jgi:hypothetical protein